MTQSFYDAIIKSWQQYSFAKLFEIDLLESTLFDDYRAQIAVLKSSRIKVGVVLDRLQVNFFSDLFE